MGRGMRDNFSIEKNILYASMNEQTIERWNERINE